MTKNTQRRKLMQKGGMLLAAGMFGVAGQGAIASEQMQRKQSGGKRAVAVDSSEEGICATCEYWGGMRRVSRDKSQVFCETLGWCNNSESHNYQSVTTPITGPMKAWVKWQALS